MAALRTIQPGIGEEIFAALQSPETSLPESVLPLLINELAAIPAEVILVLDDYHVIETASIHEGLTFLLLHLPPRIHLAITSRSEPPLPLTLLRGRGQLTELRTDDLRFTLAEVSEFLQQVMGLSLTVEQIAMLEERTEGWIAGLQMAALSLQGEENVTGFIQAFRGDDRHILDYLIEQVLNRQPEQVQSFLLQTSILNRLCGALCEAVTGQPDGQATLEALEQGNLFLMPLDNKRQWYRYHPLFAGVLRTRLTGNKAELYRKAADWYAQNGLFIEAVAYTLSAGDHEAAARMIERAYRAMFKAVEPTTMLAWLRALPEELIRSRPFLCCAYAYVLFNAGQHATGETWLAVAERLLQESRWSEAEAADLQDMWFDVFRWRMANAGSAGDTAQIEALSRQARALFPADNGHWPYAITGLEGFAYWFSMDMVTAEQRIQAALLNPAPSDIRWRPRVVAHLSEVQWERGRLRQAEQSYLQVCRFASDSTSAEASVFAARSLASLGRIHYEWNHLATATEHFQQALALGRRLDEVNLLISTYAGLAWVSQAQGDSRRVTDLIQRAQSLEPRMSQDVINLGYFRAQWAYLWPVQGHLEAASRWAAGLDFSIDELVYLRREEHLVLARVFIAQGKAEDALRLLDRLWQRAKVQEWFRVQLLTLRALALQARDQRAAALASLRQALALGEPEGYVRTFVDEGQPMAELFRTAAAQGIAPAYIARLLAAFSAPAAPTLPTTPAMGEPLTRRELQILRWLTKDLSSLEIARELVIAESTVNSHIKSIYRKLNVHNRSEAIERADELSLL